MTSEDEAVKLANDTPFGLGSYLYTTDEKQALRVADQIDAGMVWVNIVLGDGAELPFGGVKRSGSGRELGRFGADEFVNKKLIRDRRLVARRSASDEATSCRTRRCDATSGPGPRRARRRARAGRGSQQRAGRA